MRHGAASGKSMLETIVDGVWVRGPDVMEMQ